MGNSLIIKKMQCKRELFPTLYKTYSILKNIVEQMIKKLSTWVFWTKLVTYAPNVKLFKNPRNNICLHIYTWTTYIGIYYIYLLAGDPRRWPQWNLTLFLLNILFYKYIYVFPPRSSKIGVWLPTEAKAGNQSFQKRHTNDFKDSGHLGMLHSY